MQKDLNIAFLLGGKRCVCMGHGVNSEGTEREIMGTRVSVTVECRGRGDCKRK